VADMDSTTVAQPGQTLAGTVVIQTKDLRRVDKMLYEVGPQLCVHLVRLLKLAEMYKIDHRQTIINTREVAQWLAHQLREFDEDAFQIQLTEANIFFNGQLLRLDSRTFAKVAMLKATFLEYSVNQMTFRKGIEGDELLLLVSALKDMKSGVMFSVENFEAQNLELAFVVERELDLPDVDERRKLVELYANLLVKTSMYFHRLRRGSNPSAKHIKRIVQNLSTEVVKHPDVFTGLINLRLIGAQDFMHAVNTSIYAMLLGDALQLERLDLVRIGMTAVTQDIDRIQGEGANTSEESSGLEAGDETHFRTNLSSVIAMSGIGGEDVLSALRLVTSYERGFPYCEPMPKSWYRDELRPHLLSRIIEIGRHYDAITQGKRDVPARTPDIALQLMIRRMGEHFDPELFRLFINLVGIFPVGSMVELSNGEKALVVRSPSLLAQNKLSNATRPVVRLISSEQLLDLSLESNRGLHILRIVEPEEIEDHPGAFFLF
jgi:HD-GYP domain-containing protein (c-di-GMP phosphodiesterase class II)